MHKRILHYLGPLIGISIFATALWILYHYLKGTHYHQVAAYLVQLPQRDIMYALLFTVLGYFIMTFYDFLALYYVQHPLPYKNTSFISFIGFAFSNNIGYGMITGGSIRSRLYSALGLNASEIIRIIAFYTFTFWIGYFATSGITILLEPLPVPSSLHLPFASLKPLGVIFLLIAISYLILPLIRKRPILIKGWELILPSPPMVLAQIAISSLDWILAGAVLFMLLPPTQNLAFPLFLGMFLFAQIAGILSTIPGGLGVFETIAILFLSPYIPPAQIIGALVAFRLLYYIMPLSVAALLLGTYELLWTRKWFHRTAEVIKAWVPGIIPNISAFTIFVSGAILLFSGVTPAVGWRMELLKDLVPLPVMEISHFLGSITGISLLLIARSLQRRYDAAYYLTVVLLIFGITLSILKGFDFEEASILFVMLLAFLPSHRYFYRKASLLNQYFTPAWIVAIAVVLICVVWIGFFSFKHIEYSHELWWRFSLFEDAPRSLRATVGVVGVLIFVSVSMLLKPATAKSAPPTREEMKLAQSIAQGSTKTYAYLAFNGDKSFLFSENKKAFIMYSIEGRSWVAMGDPVGPKEEYPELVWKFREMCDNYDGWPSFYEVDNENLHLYLDLGLTMVKLGEEAHVHLPEFTLEGTFHKALRNVQNKMNKDGFSFEIVPPEQVPGILPEIKIISDTWIEEKNTREKGFSLGFFDEEYLKQFSIAVVKQNHKIYGFANMMFGAKKEELTIELMRYTKEAPHGIMDYLFINLMFWGKNEGYQWFNLGMAPLSGLENKALAPLWNRIGSFIFQYGEYFYNFQGLRKYKEKFSPVWSPKYLASPGGIVIPRMLTNITALVSKGLKGVISR